MATPKPGEIRCPTCHRSTPPAAFCTQCGSAIPSDARIRPRGMDRDELQDRIRARRSGGDPYRRGTLADDGSAGYQRFQPDPTDARARRGAPADDRRQDVFRDRTPAAVPPPPTPAGSLVPPLGPRPDVTREADEWGGSTPSAIAPLPPPPAEADRPADAEPAYVEPAYVDNYDDAAYTDEEGYPYDYEAWDDDRDRRSSGAGAFAILGFLALGVLALLGGALLAGVFGEDPSTGGINPTLTPSPTFSATVAPSQSTSAAPSASAAPSDEPAESGGPVVFPDGFTAVAEPCIPGSVRQDGCGSSGAVNSGQVEIWVGFQKGSPSDVVGVAILDPDGNTVGDVSIDLERIGCQRPCNGYTFFNFSNLGAGSYEVRVTRNGEPASSTSFEVS